MAFELDGEEEVGLFGAHVYSPTGRYGAEWIDAQYFRVLPAISTGGKAAWPS